MRFGARPASPLTPITQAVLWALLGGLCSTVMNVLIRLSAEGVHPFEVTFFRCFFGLVFMLPWIARSAGALLHTPKIAFFTLRAAISLVSMLTWFYGIALVPLATATAVNFTAPLFSTIGAALILREDVRLRRWSAVAIGFIGVLIIMRPGASALDANLLIILLSAATAAMSNITVKFLARTERPSAIVAFLVIYLTPLSLIPALFVWTWPSWSALGIFVALGCVGTLAHIAMVRALAAADASAIAPLDFLRLPFAAITGFLIFGEVTDFWTWAGAGLIISSTLYVAHREAKLARLGRAALARSRR